MEQYIVRDEVAKTGWDYSTVEMIPKDTWCHMDCVSFCFTDHLHRFENIPSIEQYCLIAQCNCRTGRVTYREHINSTG